MNPSNLSSPLSYFRQWRDMDAVILARLEHSSPEKRLSTMLELKQSVMDKGHLLIANVKKLFLIIKDR
jgi:hypothetical protein